MARHLKLIIFDLDGTLVDAYRAVWLSLNAAFQKLGFKKVSYKRVKESVGWGEKIFVSKFVGLQDVDKVLLLYRAHHRKALTKGVRLLPGAKKLIAQLKKEDYRLAIASNRPTVFCELILKKLKLRKYFDVVVCADRVRHPKPAGDILKKILKQLSVKPAEAVYVGDMTVDVQTGHRAKVKTIAVTTGSSKRSAILKAKPFKVIPRLNQLQNRLH